MDYTVLPANYTMPAFTSQPQSITALWLVFYRPTECRRLSRPGTTNSTTKTHHYTLTWTTTQYRRKNRTCHVYDADSSNWMAVTNNHI